MTSKHILITAVALSCHALAVAADQPTPQPAPPPQPLSIIHAGRLVAVAGEAAKQQQSIIVRGDRIEEIVPGYVVRPGAKIVDLTRLTVLPGLIDCHVHLMSSRNKDRGNGRARRSEADPVLNALENSAVTLAAGFTTVRDLGAVPAIFAVRDAIEAGRFPGPRIIAAGRMISVTAGHGDGGSNGNTGALSGVCDGPYDCRAAVRAQVGAGADVIKISATGGGADENGTADASPEMDADEMASIVDTAHSLGRKVAVHAHGTAGINAALRAGADSIEHGGFSNVESIRLYKSHKAFLVPTMSVLNGIEVEIASADPKAQPLMRSFLDRMPGNVAAAYKAGVQIAFGTDAGVTEHGQNAQEFLWYRKISMTNADALRTATVNAARLLGMESQIGTIAAGKFADIIATEGDPLTDIEALRKVVYVMKGGTTTRAYEHQPAPGLAND